MPFLVLVGALSVAAIVGTIVTMMRDGYGRVPIDPTRSHVRRIRQALSTRP